MTPDPYPGRNQVGIGQLPDGRLVPIPRMCQDCRAEPACYGPAPWRCAFCHQKALKFLTCFAVMAS